MIHRVLHQHEALLQLARKLNVQKDGTQEAGEHDCLACRHLLVSISELIV